MPDDGDFFTEAFPHPAGVSEGTATLPFELWRQQQIKHNANAFSPFEDQAECDLAQWIVDSGLAQSEIEKMLALDKVRIFQQN